MTWEAGWGPVGKGLWGHKLAMLYMMTVHDDTSGFGVSVGILPCKNLVLN